MDKQTNLKKLYETASNLQIDTKQHQIYNNQGGTIVKYTEAF